VNNGKIRTNMTSGSGIVIYPHGIFVSAEQATSIPEAESDAKKLK
jgi:hypothetical protein